MVGKNERPAGMRSGRTLQNIEGKSLREIEYIRRVPASSVPRRVEALFKKRRHATEEDSMSTALTGRDVLKFPFKNLEGLKLSRTAYDGQQSPPDYFGYARAAEKWSQRTNAYRRKESAGRERQKQYRGY